MLGALIWSPRGCPKEGIPTGFRVLPGGRMTLYDAIALLHRYLDEALCEEVFRWKRRAERERRWTLYLLVRFWTAVIVRAPLSLTQSLEEGEREGDPEIPLLSRKNPPSRAINRRSPHNVALRSAAMKWGLVAAARRRAAVLA
jgi:hypothetical protein